MYLLKNPIVLVFLIITCAVLFYLANSHSVASRIVNIISPCKQDPINSFPCHGGYDLMLMIISGILACSFIVMLAMHYIKQ
jgi:fumarate reductase subunit C